MQRFCLSYLTGRMGLPAFGMAIIDRESSFNPLAEATDPRDLARGGSRGLTQMSWRTAVTLMPKLVPENLFIPSVNLDCFLLLYHQNLHRLSRSTIPGTSAWVRGLASLHNAGRILQNPSQEVVAYMDSVERLYDKWSQVTKAARETGSTGP